MTTLRQRMTEDMRIRNLALNTQTCYLQQVSLFVHHFNKSPSGWGLRRPDACPLASPHASTTPESCGTHTAPGSARSPGYGLAVPSTPSGDFGSDRCRGQPVEPGRHAAHWPGAGSADNRPEAGAARAIPLFSQDILKHRLVQAQLSHQLLQPAVLVLQLPRLPDLVRLQAYVLLLPAIEGLLADPHLPDQLGHRYTNLSLFQHSDDLVHRKTLLIGKILSPQWAQFWPKTNIYRGSKYPGPINEPCASIPDAGHRGPGMGAMSAARFFH